MTGEAKARGVKVTEEAIEIRGLRLFGRHGVREAERTKGQIFMVDVRLELHRPAHEDDLSQTVDYSQVIEQIERANDGRAFQLLESLARSIGEGVLADYPAVTRAWVRVRKRLLWSGTELGWVAAEVSCAREG